MNQGLTQSCMWHMLTQKPYTLFTHVQWFFLMVFYANLGIF